MGGELNIECKTHNNKKYGREIKNQISLRQTTKTKVTIIILIFA